MCTQATSTDVQKNFGDYLGRCIRGEEIIITKNGQEVARIISSATAKSFLTDVLVGSLADAAESDS